MENNADKFIQKGKFRQASTKLVVPENSGLRFILNPIDTKASFENDINQTLATKWRKVREEGKAWHANKTGFGLGEFHSVAVQSDIWALNVCVLNEAGTADKDALEKAFKKICTSALYEKASLHTADSFLKLGFVEEMATKHFINKGLSVYVYTK